MHRRFDKPERVGFYGIFIACDFLLLVPPVWQFNFMGEEIAPCQRMPEPELRPQCPYPLLGLPVPFIPTLDFNKPVVICISREPWHSVRGNFILEVNVGHGWADVVRVDVLFSCDVAELDAHSGCNKLEGQILVVKVSIFASVEDTEVVVLITMRVKGDLLL